MTLTKLILIKEQEINGKKKFVKADSGKIIPAKNIEILKKPPIILDGKKEFCSYGFGENRTFRPYIKKEINFRANALLLGDYNSSIDDFPRVYSYAVSYCKVKKMEKV
ncbi:hypothetical protein KAJ87_04575 [Candidatus Pacearchaeota archaeon]|nr:hypothetical protein [Candidatus Pacearchaeota archaeon]